MTRKPYFLVIRADQTVRIAQKPRVAGDEIAIRLTLDFPSTWGRILNDQYIDIRVPDFTPTVEYIEPEVPDEG